MSKLKILFVAANPSDTTLLALPREYREITDAVRAAKYRDRIDVVFAGAVRPGDLQKELNEHRPQVVHFGCHGGAKAIALHADNDTAQSASCQPLVQLLSTLKGDIQLVFLNCCESEPLAEAITKVIDCAIGMSDKIRDDTAIRFAAAFYQAIASSCSIGQAFEQAQFVIGATGEEHIPKLHRRVRADVILVSRTDPSEPREKKPPHPPRHPGPAGRDVHARADCPLEPHVPPPANGGALDARPAVQPPDTTGTQTSRPSRLPAILGVGLVILLLVSLLTWLLMGNKTGRLTKVWDAYNQGDCLTAKERAEEIIRDFKRDADRLQDELTQKGVEEPPVVGTVSSAEDPIIKRGLLNDVATCLWLKGRCAENLGQFEEARRAYQQAKTLTYARCLDENGRTFFSPARKASDDLDRLDEASQK